MGCHPSSARVSTRRNSPGAAVVDAGVGTGRVSIPGDAGAVGAGRVSSAAGMWVMDTDIALTSFTGQDGLNVFARSLQSAQPLAGLELVLLTRGNEPVAKAITAADGRVNFAAGLLKGRGAAEAFAVMASDASKQEFARLELSKAAFDFSDREAVCLLSPP